MTVTTAAQADVLGRLLIVQQMLDALPDEQQIGEFTRRALVQIPGVKDVLVCLRGQMTPPDARYQAICAQCGQALEIRMPSTGLRSAASPERTVSR